MKRNFFHTIALFTFLNSALLAQAISPTELQKQFANGRKITIVDIRPTTVFQKGHIPGAINIPAALVAEKTLPPLGKVVVYDEGLGGTAIDAAVTELNKKSGIEAEALEGGFSAWEMSRATTTQPGGMERETIHFITYDELKKARPDQTVLIDLRKPKQTASEQRSFSSAVPKTPPSAAPEKPLTDLMKEFPKMRINKSPFDLPQGRKETAAQTPPSLFVLIDNGDGSAQETARALKANGNNRVVVLAGGEDIIARGGKPGLQRAGATHQGEMINRNAPEPK